MGNGEEGNKAQKSKTRLESLKEIRDIYKKLRKDEMSMEEVTAIAKDSLKVGNLIKIEKLSNLIFARAEEKIKREFAKELKRNNLEEFVPIKYRKFIKDFETL